MKRMKKVLVVTVILSAGVCLAEILLNPSELLVERNTYGEGKKTEEYQLTVENELEKEIFSI